MPFTEEEYALLRGGPEGIARWNALRKSEERKDDLPELTEADLSGADLVDVNLRKANLRKANLREANLRGANLIWADLVDANLNAADLVDAKLSEADLRGANLIGANLFDADLLSTDLTGARLAGAKLIDAYLLGADLSEADLSGADLSCANLTNAALRKSFLRSANFDGAILNMADLTGAVVEDAEITRIVIHALQGLPKPPSRLRVCRDWDEEVILTGDEAANFFVLPAVVEVYLTRPLTDVELGCLHFHFGEVKANGMTRDVYLVGHRREGDGSVLRFQGPTYEAVYAALPDLLAPFRTTAAIDWKATLDSIPKDAQPGALVALAEAALQDRRQRWPIAKKLAQVFDAFAYAEVRELKEGRSQGMVIKMATSKVMLQRLDPVTPALGPVMLNAGDHARIAIMGKGEDIEQGDSTDVNAEQIVGSVIGRGSLTARDITANVLKQASADREWAGVVKAALDALAAAKLPEADHADAADIVGKIQAEALKTDTDSTRSGRIQRWLRSLADLCEPAAKLIAALKPGG